MMVTNEKDAEDDDAAWTNQLQHPYASSRVSTAAAKP